MHDLENIIMMMNLVQIQAWGKGHRQYEKQIGKSDNMGQST